MSSQRVIQGGAVPSGSPVNDVAVIEVDGRPLVVCADQGNDVWTWDVLGDEWTRRPLEDLREYDEDDEDDEYDEEDEDDEDDGLAPHLYPDFMHVGAEVVGGRVVLATGGHHQGPALWDLLSGELLSGVILSHGGVHALDTACLDGRLAIVTGNSVPEHYEWDPSSPEWIDERRRELPGHSDDMGDLKLSRIGGRMLVASVSGDDVLVTDLERGERLHAMAGAGIFRAVVLSEGMVAAVNDAGVLWRWSLADARPITDPIRVHDTEVLAMDATAFGGRTLAVTGGDDGTARIWDLTQGVQIGPALTGHKLRINAVAVTEIRDRPVAVTAGQDGLVQVWDLTP
ncbi:WD40 repeat domain-containing protein [Micromonospora sp. NPDC047670]|uniref:WD40 repeat domain-containing protein n=1 Tax=Micromonospora sp. NPDC047670 TaxID=3364252 RepID=UPI003716FA53